MPSRSTIVAGRSLKLTVSATTRGDTLDAGGMTTSGTWSCVWYRLVPCQNTP